MATSTLFFLTKNLFIQFLPFTIQSYFLRVVITKKQRRNKNKNNIVVYSIFVVKYHQPFDELS
jgi:hypothetical protein